MQKGNAWSSFLLAIGFLLIAIAPTTNAPFPQIVAGLAVLGIGFYLIKKKR
ncbi:MAG TPA: hypothetical protein VK048_04690 [Atopostipes sp.]|nr:hypothetical protein [Atopostipes sp.]